MLTTTHEQQLLKAGGQTSPTLRRDAVLVDAIVNTGEMKGCRGGKGMHQWAAGSNTSVRASCRRVCALSKTHAACRACPASPHTTSPPPPPPHTHTHPPTHHPTPLETPAVGFPLVGGPAGTMEGGRQSEIAKAILSSKNVPYTVAAPLLIQVRVRCSRVCWLRLCSACHA